VGSPTKVSVGMALADATLDNGMEQGRYATRLVLAFARLLSSSTLELPRGLGVNAMLQWFGPQRHVLTALAAISWCRGLGIEATRRAPMNAEGVVVSLVAMKTVMIALNVCARRGVH
jgi:hypothetical protein